MALVAGRGAEPQPGSTLILKVQVLAVFLTGVTLALPRAQGAQDRERSLLTRPSIVTTTDAPAGTEALPVTWVHVDVPELRVLRAAVAIPSGTGPFPVVLLLHGTHGFARQYVEWASELARDGFIAVAACWFSGGGGPGSPAVSSPIPCPQVQPLQPVEYPDAVRLVDGLVRAARLLPGARGDRLALVGHSRGGGAIQQYLLAGGHVQAAVFHSSGFALRPWNRAAEFDVPILIMHGTADGPADGGGPNTRVERAREFEAALRANKKSVESAYCDGCGHNTFFTKPSQRHEEVKRMVQFLRDHLGR